MKIPPLNLINTHLYTGGRHRRQPGDPGLRGVLLLLQDDVHPQGPVPPYAYLQQPQGPPELWRLGSVPGDWTEGTQSYALQYSNYSLTEELSSILTDGSFFYHCITYIVCMGLMHIHQAVVLYRLLIITNPIFRKVHSSDENAITSL